MQITLNLFLYLVASCTLRKTFVDNVSTNATNLLRANLPANVQLLKLTNIYTEPMNFRNVNGDRPITARGRS